MSRTRKDDNEKKATPPSLQIQLGTFGRPPTAPISVPYPLGPPALLRGRSQSAGNEFSIETDTDANGVQPVSASDSSVSSSARSYNTPSPRRHSTASTNTSPDSMAVSPAVSEDTTPLIDKFSLMGTSPSDPLFTLGGTLRKPIPPPNFEFENDLSILESKEKDIQEKTKYYQNSLLNEVMKQDNFTEKFYNLTSKESEQLAMSIITHIWEEAIEILSFTLYNVPFGIYYTHGLNYTVMRTGPEVVNTMFKPENVSFIEKFGEGVDYKVVNLKGPFPIKYAIKEEFDFDNAIIFVPICYTSDTHALSGKKFFDVMEYFIFTKQCRVIVYLGRDAGLEENVTKRNEWLENNEKYIQQIKAMNPEFWQSNEGVSVTLVHRAELVKGLFYLNAELAFVNKLVGRKTIFKAMIDDVIKRLKEKEYLSTKSPKPKLIVPVPAEMNSLELLLGANQEHEEEKRSEKNTPSVKLKPKATVNSDGEEPQSERRVWPGKQKKPKATYYSALSGTLYQVQNSQSEEEINSILMNILSSDDELVSVMTQGAAVDSLQSTVLTSTPRVDEGDIEEDEREKDEKEIIEKHSPRMTR